MRTGWRGRGRRRSRIRISEDGAAGLNPSARFLGGRKRKDPGQASHWPGAGGPMRGHTAAPECTDCTGGHISSAGGAVDWNSGHRANDRRNSGRRSSQFSQPGASTRSGHVCRTKILRNIATLSMSAAATEARQGRRDSGRAATAQAVWVMAGTLTVGVLAAGCVCCEGFAATRQAGGKSQVLAARFGRHKNIGRLQKGANGFWKDSPESPLTADVRLRRGELRAFA